MAITAHFAEAFVGKDKCGGGPFIEIASTPSLTYCTSHSPLILSPQPKIAKSMGIER